MKVHAHKIENRAQESLPSGIQLIKPYIEILKTVPANAWDSFNAIYKNQVHLYEPTLKAGIIHAHMKDEFQKASIFTEGLKYYEAYSKQHMLLIENRALVRFKKMDSNYNTSNIPTKIQRRLSYANLDLFNFTSLKHLIEIGYIPSPTWDYFDKVVIKEAGIDEPKWVIEFDKNLKFLGSSVGSFDLFESINQKKENEEDIILKIKTK